MESILPCHRRSALDQGITFCDLYLSLCKNILGMSEEEINACIVDRVFE
jgi:hypothetical protein